MSNSEGAAGVRHVEGREQAGEADSVVVWDSPGGGCARLVGREQARERTRERIAAALARYCHASALGLECEPCRARLEAVMAVLDGEPGMATAPG